MMTTDEHPNAWLAPEERRQMRIYYVIYSVDVTRDGMHYLKEMDPNRIVRRHSMDGAGAELAGLWRQTEGDEQYDFDYLGDEMGDRVCRACGGTGAGNEVHRPDGWVGIAIEPASHGPGCWEQMPCDYCAGSGREANRYKNGGHRKWVAELTHAEFLMLAEDRCWDLDDDERPSEYEETAGSLTEYGHLGAYCVHDDEGWSNYAGEIIDAQFYVSEGEVPFGATEPINEPEEQ